jgi:hypothetical protein
MGLRIDVLSLDLFDFDFNEIFLSLELVEAG